MSGLLRRQAPSYATAYILYQKLQPVTHTLQLRTCDLKLA